MTQRISQLASTLTVTTLALTMAGTVAAHAQPAAGSPRPGRVLYLLHGFPEGEGRGG